MPENTTAQALQNTKDSLFRALQSRHSLQYFLRTAYEGLQMPLTLCDISFSILATYPQLSDPKDVLEVDGRQYIRLDTSIELEEKQHLEQMRERLHPYVVRDSKFPYEIAFQAVRISRAVVAYLFCPGRPEGFSSKDLELLEYLGQVLGIELQKSDSFTVESGLKHEYFLQELLAGHISSDTFAEQRLRQLKRSPAPHYCLLCFRSDLSEQPRIAGSYYYDSLLTLFPEALVCMANSTLCLLLPCRQISPFSDSEARQLEQFLRFNCLLCGVSYPFTMLTLAPYAMEQAAAALSRPAQDQYLYYYETEYLNHLFSKVPDIDSLSLQVSPDLRLLHQYDQAHGSEFLITLRTYLNCGRSAAKAADALHIHKSTFFYRMDRIQELLGVELYDSRRLFCYEFSFRLWDYLTGQRHHLGSKEGNDTP